MWTTDTPSSSSKRARLSRLFGGRISAPPASHYSQGGFPRRASYKKKGHATYRKHLYAALDTMMQSVAKHNFHILSLCSDSIKHPTCFQEASHVRLPLTSVIRSTHVCSFTGTTWSGMSCSPRYHPLDEQQHILLYVALDYK